MTEKEDKFKGSCPKCGYEYACEEDLVESKYDGNIWWSCPKCNKEI